MSGAVYGLYHRGRFERRYTPSKRLMASLPARVAPTQSEKSLPGKPGQRRCQLALLCVKIFDFFKKTKYRFAESIFKTHRIRIDAQVMRYTAHPFASGFEKHKMERFVPFLLRAAKSAHDFFVRHVKSQGFKKPSENPWRGEKVQGFSDGF